MIGPPPTWRPFGRLRSAAASAATASREFAQRSRLRQIPGAGLFPRNPLVCGYYLDSIRITYLAALPVKNEFPSLPGVPLFAKGAEFAPSSPSAAGNGRPESSPAGESGAGSQQTTEPAAAPGVDPLERCLLEILSLHGKALSLAALRSQVKRLDRPWQTEDLVDAVSSLGFIVTEQRLDSGGVESLGLPALVRLYPEGRPAVILGRTRAGLEVMDPLRGESPAVFGIQELSTALMAGAPALCFTPPLRVPAEQESVPRGRYGHWFWGPIASAKPLYMQVILAAFITNLFAVSASIFTMVVYDRILPNNAIDSLLALLVGMAIIFISDFAIRTLRGYFLDVAGARADLAIADSLFEHVLDLELRARRGSVGSLANVLKEFESVRDFLTSATLTTLIDIPFAVLFVVIIWMIGGPLAYVPLVILPLMLLVGLALQPALSRLVKTGFEDGQAKHAVLVETLSGLETVKALGAGAIMRRRWQTALAHQSRVGLRTRMLAQLAGNFTNLGAQAAQVAVVAAGVFLVYQGKIGMGAIIACSILVGKAVTPLAQLAQLITRAHQTWVSYKALRALMSEPREHDPARSYLPRDVIKGEIEFRQVSFRYPDQRAGGLEKVSFKIKAGERVAIIGRVGSGKTTISRLLMGFYQPTEGAIVVDGSNVRQIDPADLRRNVAAVMQDVWLMTGTVLENIACGAHRPSETDILAAAQVAGVHDFISQHPDGYGMKLGERGEGLSGGQKQAIAIARALVGKPPVLLMDEPTSAMDINAERQLIERLGPVVANGTLIVITHKATLLELVDRVIVIDAGKVVADGPKEQVLGSAQPQRQPPVRPVSAAA